MDSVNILESEVTNDDKAIRDYVGESALWKDMKAIKHVMLEDLRKCGWNI